MKLVMIVVTLVASLAVESALAQDSDSKCPNPEGWVIHDLPAALASHKEWVRKRGWFDPTASEKVNFCNADLSGVDLSGAQLYGANLRGANLRKAELSAVSLGGATLIEADLKGANLEQANLHGANLSGAQLYGSNLRAANLRKAELVGTNFTNADLRGAKLRKAELNGAILNGANLRGADLSSANLDRANLRKSNLREARLTRARLNGANLSRANLKDAKLIHADLSDAQLVGTKLIDVDMRGADLSSADLDHADLAGSNLFGAKLIHADLSDAQLDNVNLTDADLFDATLTRATLTGANLRGANLTNADLSGANLFKAELVKTILANAKFSNVILSEAHYQPATAPAQGWLSGIVGLQTVRFCSLETSGLVQLRTTLKAAGLRDLEREATYALGRGLTHSALLRWNGSEVLCAVLPRDRWVAIEGIFRLVFFEWTTDYGLAYGRPILILLGLIGVFAVIYLLPLIINPRQIDVGGIYRIWPEGRIERRGAKLIQTQDVIIERLSGRDLSALGYAFYFSVVSAFHLGWRDLNVGTWIARLQPREYALRGKGWVRVVSGIQSLISVYLIAMWVLTYFGRPFE